MRNIIIFLIISLSSFSSFANSEDLFKGQTSIEDPFKLRDPFLPPSLKQKTSSKRIKEIFDGKFSNVKKIKEKFDVNTASVVGVLIGKDRRVMVKIDSENEIYIMKEGDLFGSRDMTIKAILPGGIMLVEKITNIYGENEYIETVIPISK